ncbi:hypothetical protein IWW34DRAFT_856037 [Fusarium oxysporum f. sp. albedinis]|nr:hypothetical protein IWW34DRAFT_856037 [Fusarium oxysporum f. sp. albedinis]
MPVLQLPTAPVVNKPVIEIGSSSKESGTLSSIKQTCQTLATDDATAVDSDTDDYIGKSAVDNDDNY